MKLQKRSSECLLNFIPRFAGSYPPPQDAENSEEERWGITVGMCSIGNRFPSVRNEENPSLMEVLLYRKSMKKKVGWGERVSYGLSDTASDLIFQMITIYLMFFIQMYMRLVHPPWLLCS